ncbi:MAG: efflux RND transporter periplasmic adaptor subunit [Verrucomicrobiaceae bacterium]|nr:MAG: efflux RND transporter periplasmic adaptor subunit [Verrucomicrobiaceae bacterium]
MNRCFSPKLLLTALAGFSLILSAQAEEVQGVVLAVKQVSVSSPVLQEVIREVLVNEGDTVKEGQPIVQLENAKEELAVQEGERLVENAKFVAKGMQALADDKMGSREQALKAQTELRLAEIRLAASQVALKEKTVRAPLNGIVVKKHKESGESVDRAEKLIDIVNIDQVYVQFYVNPKLLPDLQQDSEVTVRFAEPINAKFQGKIDFIAPNIDASSGLLRVKVLIDNPDHVIKAGLKGSASFGK